MESSEKWKWKERMCIKHHGHESEKSNFFLSISKSFQLFLFTDFVPDISDIDKVFEIKSLRNEKVEWCWQLLIAELSNRCNRCFNWISYHFHALHSKIENESRQREIERERRNDIEWSIKIIWLAFFLQKKTAFLENDFFQFETTEKSKLCNSNMHPVIRSIW